MPTLAAGMLLIFRRFSCPRQAWACHRVNYELFETLHEYLATGQKLVLFRQRCAVAFSQFGVYPE
jgi:hypothetical protein